MQHFFSKRSLCLIVLVIAMSLVSRPSQGQSVVFDTRDYFTVGSTIGLYPTGGGFGLGDQGFDYQGAHFDLIRLGFTQEVISDFMMELSLLFGLSVLADPGYVGVDSSGNDAQNNLGFHWGFGIGGYYVFDLGLTLGVAGEMAFLFGEAVDSSLFRLVPTVGWEFQKPLSGSFWHLRWVTGITLLNGLGELNTAPLSNLTSTGIQLIYGF